MSANYRGFVRVYFEPEQVDSNIAQKVEDAFAEHFGRSCKCFLDLESPSFDMQLDDNLSGDEPLEGFMNCCAAISGVRGALWVDCSTKYGNYTFTSTGLDTDEADNAKAIFLNEVYDNLKEAIK